MNTATLAHGTRAAHGGSAASAQDLSISLQYDWERRNWMHWLGCTEDELVHAVESVGNDCDNVRRFLRQAR